MDNDLRNENTLWNSPLSAVQLGHGFAVKNIIFPQIDSSIDRVAVLIEGVITQKKQRSAYITLFNSADGSYISKVALDKLFEYDEDQVNTIHVGRIGEAKAVFVTHTQKQKYRSDGYNSIKESSRVTAVLATGEDLKLLWTKTFSDGGNGLSLLCASSQVHNVVLFVADSAYIRAVKENGDSPWKYSVGSGFRPSSSDQLVLCDRHHLVLYKSDNRLHAIHQESGKLIWGQGQRFSMAFERPKQSDFLPYGMLFERPKQSQSDLSASISSAILCKKGSLFYTGQDAVYQLDSLTGQSIARFEIQPAKTPTKTVGWAPVLNNDGSLLFACVHQQLQVFQVKTKSLLWSYTDSACTQRPQINARSFCVFCHEGSIIVLDGRSGQTMYTASMYNGKKFAKLRFPFMAGDALVLPALLQDEHLPTMLAFDDETLERVKFLIDHNGGCDGTSFCSCPRVGVPKGLFDQVNGNFNPKYVDSFAGGTSMVAQEVLSKTRCLQTSPVSEIRMLLQKPPRITSELVSWGRDIGGRLFTGVFARFALSFKDAVQEIASCVRSNTFPLLSLNEVVRIVNEAFPPALEYLQSECQQSEAVLSNHAGIEESCKQDLYSFLATHEKVFMHENVATRLDSASSDVLASCKKSVTCLKSSETLANNAVKAILEFVSQAKRNEGEGSGILKTALGLHKNTDTGHISKRLVPGLPADVQQHEVSEILRVESALSKSVEYAQTHTSILKDIIQTLNASHTALLQFSDRAEALKQSQDAFTLETTSLSSSRAATLSDVKCKLSEMAPRKSHLEAMHKMAKIHAQQSRKIMVAMQKHLHETVEVRTNVWNEICNNCSSALEAHNNRLLAGNLGAITVEDFRIMLHRQGLTTCADVFLAESIDGQILLPFLTGKSSDQFANTLDDIFKSKITDMISRKRVIHHIELVYFGMNADEYSVRDQRQVLADDTCCRWNTQRVLEELSNAGFSELSPKFSKVNGEVLLLLQNVQDLEALGITGLGIQSRVLNWAKELSINDPVGRRRQGHRRPVLQQQPGVGASVVETYVIPYANIMEATSAFSAASMVGAGGFGNVYRCTLSFGGIARQCAVKKLSQTSMQGEAEFQREVDILMVCKHEHIVPLWAFSMNAGERCLVYPFMAGGSLDDKLADTSEALSGEARLRIAVDILRAVIYLHTPAGSKPVIVHRDIKPANILLDENNTARLSDVGLARLLYDGGAQAVSTRIVGSPGYICPMYAQDGMSSPSCDSFSLGVVVLQLVTNLPALDPDVNQRMRHVTLKARRARDYYTFIVDKNVLRWSQQGASSLFQVGVGLSQDFSDDRMTLNEALNLLERLLPATTQGQGQGQSHCCVCLMEDRSVRFKPCGHKAACQQCAGLLERCPLCRERITDRVAAGAAEPSYVDLRGNLDTV